MQTQKIAVTLLLDEGYDATRIVEHINKILQEANLTTQPQLSIVEDVKSDKYHPFEIVVAQEHDGREDEKITRTSDDGKLWIKVDKLDVHIRQKEINGEPGLQITVHDLECLGEWDQRIEVPFSYGEYAPDVILVPICGTCATHKEDGNSFCENGHDNWIEERDFEHAERYWKSLHSDDPFQYGEHSDEAMLFEHVKQLATRWGITMDDLLKIPRQRRMDTPPYEAYDPEISGE